MSSGAPRINCPGCGKPMVYSTTNAWRPFCSERCKQMDFGAWASEQFRVPDAESEPGAQDDSPSGIQDRLH